MELSWRTGLILVGLIVVVLIIVDGVRRMRRARSDALKLDISNEFKFPEDNHNPELPGGGFRVVDNDPSSISGASDGPDIFAEKENQAVRFSGMSAPRRVSEERLEPVFGNEPEIPEEPYSIKDELSRQPLDVSDDGFENTISTWLEERESEARLSDTGSDSAARMVDGQAAIIPKARPIDLDEEVPILTSVEDLGNREVSISVDEGPKVAVEVSSDSIDQSIEAVTEEVVADPHLEQEVEASSTWSSESTSTLDNQDSDNVPGVERGPVVFANPDADQLANRTNPEVVLSIHACCRNDSGFPGEALLHLFGACDLRYGREGIFHRYEEADGRGPIQFSVSQTFEPGIFDPNTITEDSFSSLSFFMSLPGPTRALEAYLAMSEMARVMETQLNAELLDSSRSVFTRQTVEHDRQQIVDFERRRQLAVKKKTVGKRRRR